jgi:RNA polymerase sigma-32 factor
MSKTTIALEAAVAAVLSETTTDATLRTPRQRANIDRAFSQIIKLIAPRIRHFIRQYGLVAHWEDAEQCCAIAVHRAIHSYDPQKAQFTTFINWQIRGELQGLRFRMMVDQRPSARKVAATTVSMHGITSNVDGEEMSLEAIIEDEDALSLTESAASDYLAKSATAALLDVFVANARSAAIETLRKRPTAKRLPANPVERAELTVRRLLGHGIDPIELERLEQVLSRDRAIVESRLFETPSTNTDAEGSVTKERARQISRRAAEVIADLPLTNPRFALMVK